MRDRQMALDRIVEQGALETRDLSFDHARFRHSTTIGTASFSPT